MGTTLDFQEIGRLPAPGDNVAIAVQRLEASTAIKYSQTQFSLDYTVLEGHRFAVRPIATGELLLSWGLPFGVATRPIAPGNYVCNALMIDALNGRSIDFEVPDEPNFRDQVAPYTLDEKQFKPGQQVPIYDQPRTFMGYRRSPARGVGTRNTIVILGTTSSSASYARQLAQRLQDVTAAYDNIDGIAPVAHTEGSGRDALNNRNFVLRTLAGLIVHPNVGAVLVADYGRDPITNQDLRQYMLDHHYPLPDVLHCFLTLEGDLQTNLEAGAAVVKGWLDQVNETKRSPQSLSHLKIALQCGGSDAFSGVSGNPLAASVAREIIRYGGSANLAETDELIGAEAYMLQNVRDLDTARAFLNFIAEFKERLSWHGVTAEGNPSGGNRYRGLYNIALKSIGAAMKRHPDVRLDYAVDYAQRMERPGFTFMNTPGNDLESIAGQVAGGSNLIFFVTGNGSITNFPFVPTIKIMTTSGRYQMLPQEMDVNAGAYQDGVPMDDLTRETLDLAVAVASGQQTHGEKAGHSQISIWRNWRQTGAGQIEPLLARPRPSGRPIPIHTTNRLDDHFQFQAFRSGNRLATDQVGLILPTSLCASQIARMSAAHLNQTPLAGSPSLSRFVALAHSEGCGLAVHPAQDLYDRTMINTITHPLVRFGLFLEHGCEKTHNDYMRRQLQQRGHDPASFGWASVQLDGGIDAVLHKIEAWFRQATQATAATAAPATETAELAHLSLGLHATSSIPPPVAQSLAQLTRTAVAAGGSVVVPQTAALLASPPYLQETLLSPLEHPSLAYGQAVQENGFHVMETPSSHWVETLTGLAATGVELMLAYSAQAPRQGHPLVPLIQITAVPSPRSTPTTDFDLVLAGDSASWAKQIMQLVMQVASRQYVPRILAQGHVDFQLSRGLLGVST